MVNLIASYPFFLYRLLWAITVLTMKGVAMTLIINNILRFFDYPTETKTVIRTEGSLEFPAMTICNMNKFRSYPFFPIIITLKLKTHRASAAMPALPLILEYIVTLGVDYIKHNQLVFTSRNSLGVHKWLSFVAFNGTKTQGASICFCQKSISSFFF